MIHRTGLVPAALAAVFAGAASAHHSFGAIYDQSREVALEGTVTAFRFVHPHPFLEFTATDDQGVARSWRAELDNRFELEEIGVSAQTFRPGDRVSVRGSPGRANAGILYLWKLSRPRDGLEYGQVGFKPYLRRPGVADPD
jgi:hypothetical protein